MYAIKDFKNCCRLCLKDLSTLQAAGENGYFRIAEHRVLQLMIVNCFEILITDDEVVNKICSSCKDEVHHFNTIRKKVIAADYEIRNFYVLLESKGLDKPPEEPIVLSGKVKPELALKSDVEQKISLIENDTGKQNSKHDVDHREEEFLEETECLVVKYEYIGSDSARKANDIDPGKCTTKKRHKPRNKTNPAKRKYKKKVPKISYSDYRCFICSTDLANQDELSTHLATHIDPDNPQKCSICDLNVLTVRNLNMHLRKIHFRTGKRIPCEECRKNGIVREYSSTLHLAVHTKSVHEGIVTISDKKFVCSHCGKKFVRCTTLKAHENIHTKAKTYPCTRCSSSFSTRGSLNRHQSIHSIEKPFVCDQCGTAFRRPFNLQMHKANRHSDDRPFGCEICGARFKVKMALSAHQRIHGTEREVKDD